MSQIRDFCLNSRYQALAEEEMLSSLLDKETKENEKSFNKDDRIPNSVLRDALPSFPNDEMILFWYSTPL